MMKSSYGALTFGPQQGGAGTETPQGGSFATTSSSSLSLLACAADIERVTAMIRSSDGSTMSDLKKAAA